MGLKERPGVSSRGWWGYKRDQGCLVGGGGVEEEAVISINSGGSQACIVVLTTALKVGAMACFRHFREISREVPQTKTDV